MPCVRQRVHLLHEGYVGVQAVNRKQHHRLLFLELHAEGQKTNRRGASTKAEQAREKEEK